MANLSSTDKPIVEGLLANFYQTIKPYLGGTTYVSGFTPVGTVISVMATAAPQHYLACDGTAYSISDYPELAEHIKSNFGSYNFFGGNGTTTFAVPDLRGEFLRGTGTNSHANCGNGANVGVHQDGTEHAWVAYNTTNSNVLLSGNTNEGVVAQKLPDKVITESHTRATITGATSATSNATKGYTSRPTNTSVLYCIATKDIYIDARQDYSTTEKVLGTWIDGKPLYQKTVHTGAFSNKSLISANHNISNLGEIVSIDSVCHDSNNGTYCPIPYVQDNNANQFAKLQVTNTTIQILNRNFDFSAFISDSYVTIRYTKTTD